MKRLLIITLAMCFLMADDSPVGNWKLSGLKVDYLNISRAPATVALHDAYGLNVVVPVSEIPAGVMFLRLTNGPFTQDYIDANNLNLNVNVYPNNTGAIADGSYYPDIDLVVDEAGNQSCVSAGQFFPVNDTFVWEQGAESTFATVNTLGIPGINDLAGTQAWGFGVSETNTFDDFPPYIQPERVPAGLPYVALTDGTVLGYACDTALIGAACASAGIDAAADPSGCQAALVAAGQIVGDGSGPLEVQIGQCMAADYATAGAYFGGAGWLHGSGTSGFFKLNTGASQICPDGVCQDVDVDFLLEWNGIDGPNTGSGYGDDPDVDEDADGSSWDRIFGLPAITATFVTDTCPLLPPNADGTPLLPIAGDVTGQLSALITGECLATTTGVVTDQCLGGAAYAAGLYCDGYCAQVVGATEGAYFDGCVSECLPTATANYTAQGAQVTVTGLCNSIVAGLDPDIETQCLGAAAAFGSEAAGVGAIATSLCLGAGFDDENCADLVTLIASQGVVTCAALAANSGALCEGAAGLVESTDDNADGSNCDEWAASVADGFAAQSADTGYNTCTDLGAATEAACVAGVGTANEMYLVNPDPSLATWSYFLTANAVTVQGLLGAGYSMTDIIATQPQLFADDSGWAFNGENGRLTMVFDPLCVPEVEGRQIVAEFVDLGELCDHTGDVDGNGTVNVNDIVIIVGHIFGTLSGGDLGGVAGCEADYNDDDVINVTDIVFIVQVILNGRTASSLENATNATVVLAENNVSIKSNGYIGGIDMVVEFAGNDLVLDLNDDFIVSDYVVYSDNTARIIGASATNIERVFDVTSGTVTAVKDVTLVTSTDDGYGELDGVNIEAPASFTIGTAYPNPFNPSTNLSLVLNTKSDISVKVYNIIGQLVDVIAEGSYSPNTYNWTWNAENLASGVYLVKTQVGSNVETQKIMLLK